MTKELIVKRVVTGGEITTLIIGLMIARGLSYLAWPFTLLFLIGLAIVLVVCFYWVSKKNRHWAWGLFGILAPIGLIPIIILKVRTKDNQPNQTNLAI